MDLNHSVASKIGEEKIQKITYYKLDGTIDHQQVLNYKNIADTNGMIIRCILKNGETLEGYSDPYRTDEKSAHGHSTNNLTWLSTWDNLDETTHRLIGDGETKYSQTSLPVRVDDILSVDAILYSNPRWGARLTNHFFIDTSTKRND